MRKKARERKGPRETEAKILRNRERDKSKRVKEKRLTEEMRMFNALKELLKQFKKH